MCTVYVHVSPAAVLSPRNHRRLSLTTHPREEDETNLIRLHLPEMEIIGAIEFKMDKKSYRMIPLANSEDYLYNRGALRRGREVGAGWSGHCKWLGSFNPLPTNVTYIHVGFSISQ